MYIRIDAGPGDPLSNFLTSSRLNSTCLGVAVKLEINYPTPTANDLHICNVIYIVYCWHSWHHHNFCASPIRPRNDMLNHEVLKTILLQNWTRQTFSCLVRNQITKP